MQIRTKNQSSHDKYKEYNSLEPLNFKNFENETQKNMEGNFSLKFEKETLKIIH